MGLTHWSRSRSALAGQFEPLAKAIDEVIGNGTSAEVLKRWNLSGEAVAKSCVDPPGLPRTGRGGERRRGNSRLSRS